MIHDKRILFLTPFFYNYHNLITSELEHYGNSVTIVQNDIFHREFAAEWNNGFLPKVMRFIFRWERRKHKIRVENCNSKLYLDSYPELHGKYDVVFVIRGDYLPNQVYEFLRKNNPAAHFVLYQMDSVVNLIKFDHAKYFDRLLTFDPIDARKYSMAFRPLFYAVNTQTRLQIEKDIDILFVGSLHSDRLVMLKKLIDHYGSRYRIIHHLVGNSNDVLVKKKKLEYTEYMNLMERSRCVVDFPVSRQNGLTIRTLEAIAARTKLITSNRRVVDYDFYKPSNILIVNKWNLAFPTAFIEEPYMDLDNAVLQEYSISQWVEDVFS